MNSGSDSNEVLDCSVCHQRCTRPKKLPKCEHSYCEICIFLYIVKLGDVTELDKGIPCNSCGSFSSGPATRNEVMAWIEALEMELPLKRNRQLQNQTSCLKTVGRVKL